MQPFATARDAKEFLITKIITQAQLERVSLTDIEKKMMYFSESAWTLPDIDQVNDAFERDYDQTQYENKIGKLIRNFLATAHKENREEFELWKKAVATIRREDHYLLVLIDASYNPSPDAPWSRFLKLLAMGFGIACTILIVGYLFIKIYY